MKDTAGLRVTWFFYCLDEDNAGKILEVIKEFMGSLPGFTKEDFLKQDNVIILGRPPFRIDIFTSISGVSFTEGFNSSNVYVDGNLAIRSLHISELIRNKKSFR